MRVSWERSFACLIVFFKKHGVSMAVGEREGDRLFVLHKANEPSGGKRTPMELGDFLRHGNAGPEHQALRRMIGSLLDE
jgi:hypothetical protein